MSSSEEDTKISCKYGANCYQKNPAHHAKYKHPEKRRRSVSPETTENLKKQKPENEQKKSPRTEETSENEERNENEAHSENEAGENQDVADEEEWVNNVKLLESFEERKDFIKEHFLVDMPDDFYSFWDLCKMLNKDKPKEAFKLIGLTLVGPYDILDETLHTVNSNQKLFLHWRYYYDPPEFQTIIKGDEKTGYHIGYFRDSPDDKPSFVGYNEANKDCTISQLGDNVFGAVNTYLEKYLRRADPFKKLTLTKLQKAVSNKAKELNFNLNSHGKSRKTVCKSFHTAGISVPYNRSTQIGYRPLPISEKELKKTLGQVVEIYKSDNNKAFSSIQSIITAATIANDECDFGTALEFGIDLFCYGHDCFNTIILNILKVTYALLSRHAFAEIIEEHLKCRNKEKPCIVELNN